MVRDQSNDSGARRATHNQRLGRLGEDAAARWYESEGYVVVDRNWRNNAGELDLVVVLPSTRRAPSAVVFVEVKTRSTAKFGDAVLAVDWKKQERIRRLAGAWLADQAARFGSIRYDIAAVDGEGNVNVYEDAF